MAPRERLMPFKRPQNSENRRNAKSITAIGKGSEVVVFNSTGTISATSQAMYQNLERSLQRADAVEMAADIAFEMMMQLRKSSRERTGLEESQGRYIYKDYDGTMLKQAGLLIRDKWFYMLSRPDMSKQEIDDQTRFRFHTIDFVGIVGPWDARWDDRIKVWYDLLWYLIQKVFLQLFGHYEDDKHNAMQACIVTRRDLQKLNLDSEQDAKRHTAVELAMQYVKLMLKLKSWKTKKNNRVDVRSSMAKWWHGVLAQGKMHESPAETLKNLDRLVQEAEDWLYRVTPIKMIEYFIRRTMQGEPASLIKACAAAQTHGMQISNWRRMAMGEDNRSYTFKKSDS